MNELALFAGAGGGILGGLLSGFRTVCAVEIDSFCREVLLRRQMDGFLPRFPIWDDVKTFNGHPWCGKIDVITGGFPCQDISSAGKGAGLTGSRSGLCYEMLRIVGEVQPTFVFAENSQNLRTRGLDQLLIGLTGLGYDCAWICLGPGDIGVSHKRARLFLLAHTNGQYGAPRLGDGGRTQPHNRPLPVFAGWGTHTECAKRYFDIRLETEPIRNGVSDGMANRVDRLRAIGNGQVPGVAALAWATLIEALSEGKEDTE